jgi:hypothetical protein
MFKIDTTTYKFPSGLTYDEADALVEQYVAGFEHESVALACLKGHLKSAVRDHKHFRAVVSSLIADQRRA